MDSAIDNHLKIGKKLFFEYRREKAAIEFRKALSIDPNNSEVIGWLALSLALQEKFDEAADLVENLEISDRAEVFITKGILSSYINEDPRMALQYYSKALSVDPRNILAYISRGLLYAQFNKGKQAKSDLDKALKISKSSYVYCSYGSMKAKLNDFRGAMDYYNKSVQLDPNNLQTYEYRANLRMMMGDYDGALEDYKKHLELAPENKWAWATQGRILEELGDFEGAMVSMNKALDIDRNFPLALSGRASIFKSTGQYELSIADQYRYYELEEIPKYDFDDPKQQEVFNTVYQHLNESVKPELDKNDEKLIDYWDCVFHWGKLQTQSVSKGNQTRGFHGKFGIGYVCLSDRYLRIVSIGSLSRKYAKQPGAGIAKKVFKALVLGNYDMRGAEKEDKFWVIPFKDIQGIYKEDASFDLITFSENWEIAMLWGDENYMFTALELARTGNLRRVIDLNKLRIKAKTSDSEDDILDKIERLASLRDRGVISIEEFEQKKGELLARL
jgi:tetratricopeptide (TPR) repeat protein